MIPFVAIVGRPNVGKSTLYNRLTRSRDALVANKPGLTRDRQYGYADINGQTMMVVDTGGIAGDEEGIEALMVDQVHLAIEEAQLILFVVDAKQGLTGAEAEIAKLLRRKSKNVLLIVNKIDGVDESVVTTEFFQLGFETIVGIAAVHGRGITTLKSHITDHMNEYAVAEDAEETSYKGIPIAVAGRPNVGKSTLVNALLQEERVIVFDEPGTTRDSIAIPFVKNDTEYTLIDTAGMRRKSRIHETVEKFSVIKSMQSIAEAKVVIFLLDASEGVVEQDLALIGLVLEKGASIVIALNKWDVLDPERRRQIKRELDRKLAFVQFAQVFYISAKNGKGINPLFKGVERAYKAANIEMRTAHLTAILNEAVEKHQPPLVHGRRIKLRYAHQGGSEPPLIVVHGNQTQSLPAHYKRYLENVFRDAFELVGSPVRIEFKTSDNPYAHKKNTLTERQLKSRKRMMKFVKKKKR